MAYRGPRVVCERCGSTFSRPSDLRRHLRKGRCPGRALHLAKRKYRAVRAEIIEVRPISSEIVPAAHPVVPAWPILVSKRAIVGAAPRLAPARVHDEKFAEAARLETDMGRSMSMTPQLRVQIESKIRELRGQVTKPMPADSLTLFEQYHFLKALAARLDAGRGTERDRFMFEEGLREYDLNYDSIFARRKGAPHGNG